MAAKVGDALFAAIRCGASATPNRGKVAFPTCMSKRHGLCHMKTGNETTSRVTREMLFHEGVTLVAFAIIAFTRHLVSEYLTRYGADFISLSAPSLNGFDPHWFSRVMQNLTALPVLIPYAIVAISLPLVVVRMGFRKTSLILELLSILHLAFALSFLGSLYLPVGDVVTIIAR